MGAMSAKRASPNAGDARWPTCVGTSPRQRHPVRLSQRLLPHNESDMFNPSRDEVRRFFCEAWHKQKAAQPITPIEAIAIDWIARHPEYHTLLGDQQTALSTDFSADGPGANPFLHLSMHLSVTEQLQIDQPPGIRAAWQVLLRATGDEHEAAHRVIDALAETLWEAQRNGTPPSNELYLERVLRAV